MNFNVTNDLTREQLESFNEVKRRIRVLHGEGEVTDEPRLLRFLIGRDFDPDRATEMLSNSIKWRKKVKIDEHFIKTYKMNEVLGKYYPFSHLGFTKNNDYLIYAETRCCDFIGYSKSVSKADLAIYMAYELEYCNELLKRKSEEIGKLCQTFIAIADFNKMPLSQVTNKNAMEYLLIVLMTFDANYPENLKTAYVINASTAFTIAFAMVRPLLSERTRNKIRVFGKAGWREELRRDLGPEVLPACLGGDRTDPDGNPMCTTIIKRCEPVPHHYYFTGKLEKSILSKPGVRRFEISRRSRAIIKAQVPEIGFKLEWEFQTENYDIGFGLRYVLKEGSETRYPEEDIIVPTQKMDTRVFCETGTYCCERAGTYVLIFDNSYSWFRTKELYVRVSVVHPNGQEIINY